MKKLDRILLVVFAVVAVTLTVAVSTAHAYFFDLFWWLHHY